ncbi:MAG: mechanosensitive ion channel domain-containing protein [Cyanobacteria bacterium P01_H01_bin.15]
MNLLLWNQPWLLWSLGLIFGFPLLLLLINELYLALDRRSNPLANTLLILRNFILPSMAILIFLNRVLELREQSSLVRLVTTIWLLFTIHLFLSGFKVLLFDAAKDDSWQAKVPGLFLDLVRFFLVSCIAAVILSRVWGIDLGGVITALGIGSIVIGLALQDTLKNLFAGISLIFERPFTLGDWLEVDGTIGQIVQLTWRSVYLQTRSQDLIVIPNATLIEGNFRNFNLPTPLHVVEMEYGFSYDDPPNKVKNVLYETAIATEGVLRSPEPWVRTINYADFSIIYRVGIYIDQYRSEPDIKNEFVTRVWYAAKRYKLNIPFPIETQYRIDAANLKAVDPVRKIFQILRALPNFAALDETWLTEVRPWLHVFDFARGEIIFSEGERSQGIHLLLSGEAELGFHNYAGQLVTTTHLSAGEFFGTNALLPGEKSDMSAIAIKDLEVGILEPEAVTNLIQKIPRVAQEFSELAARRRRQLRTAKRESRKLLTD